MRRTPGLLFAAAIAIGLGAGPASAADFPCSTAKLIVPWGAGGETDIIFRTFADAANRLGAEPQIQVVNIGGQGGNKGAKEAKDAKPDGCTLLALHQSAITSFFNGRVEFYWNVFEPVTLLTRTPAIVGANPDTPYDDVKGMVAAAKKSPGTITAGGTAGSTSQFWFLLVEDAAGIKFKHVPYEGTRERMTALLAKNIDLGEITLAAAKEYITSGQLKALGIATDKRNPEIPDVPTMEEQGYDLKFGTARGVVLPDGASKEIVAHYNEVFQKAAKDPKVMDSMREKGSEILAYGPEQYAKYMDETFTKWRKIAKQVGLMKD